MKTENETTFNEKLAAVAKWANPGYSPEWFLAIGRKLMETKVESSRLAYECLYVPRESPCRYLVRIAKECGQYGETFAAAWVLAIYAHIETERRAAVEIENARALAAAAALEATRVADERERNIVAIMEAIGARFNDKDLAVKLLDGLVPGFTYTPRAVQP